VNVFIVVRGSYNVSISLDGAQASSFYTHTFVLGSDPCFGNTLSGCFNTSLYNQQSLVYGVHLLDIEIFTVPPWYIQNFTYSDIFFDYAAITDIGAPVSSASSSASAFTSSATSSSPTSVSGSSPTSTSSSSHSSVGAAVGGAIGGLAVLAVFVLALLYCLRRSKARAPKHNESSTFTPFTTNMSALPGPGPGPAHTHTPIFAAAAATTAASAASSSQANLTGPGTSTTTTAFGHSQPSSPASAAGSDQRRSPEQVPLLRNVGRVAVPAVGPFGDNKAAVRHQQQTLEVGAGAGSDADADEPPQYER
jgi:hypothetical protein